VWRVLGRDNRRVGQLLQVMLDREMRVVLVRSGKCS
jgi:hypothetical protein